MVDVIEGVPQGKALDQWESAPIEGFDTRVIGSNGYDEAAGSELFIVTAGIARKPGMSRDDLVKTNAGIVESVSREIKRVAPQSIVIVVSNPLDVMCYVAMKATRLSPRTGPRHGRRARHGALPLVPGRGTRRIGRGHSGDGAGRPRRHDGPAHLLHHGFGHSGNPADRQAKLDAIVTRTRNGGAEIVALLKTGSAYYAPSAAAVQMAESIALDKKRILPCAAWLQGEYGLRDVFCGVPCKLGRQGTGADRHGEAVGRRRRRNCTSPPRL